MGNMDDNSASIMMLYGNQGVADIFSDNFNDNSIDATKWTETDTGGNVAEANQRLEFNGTIVTAYADPEMVSVAISRTTGAYFDFDVTFGEATTEKVIGLWSGSNLDPGTGNRQHLMWFYSDGSVYCREGGSEGAAATYAGATTYLCRIVTKATGATYYMDTTTRGTTQIADLAVNSGATLYIGFSLGNGGDMNMDNVRYYNP